MGSQTLLLNGHQGSFPEVKWPGHEAEHSASSSEEFKKEMSYTYTPPASQYAMHTDFTFTFTETVFRSSLKNFQEIPKVV